MVHFQTLILSTIALSAVSTFAAPASFLEYLMVAGETALTAKAGAMKMKQSPTQVKPRSGSGVPRAVSRRSLNLYDVLAARELGTRVYNVAGRSLVDLVYAREGELD